jgi:hypothetical protein
MKEKNQASAVKLGLNSADTRDKNLHDHFTNENKKVGITMTVFHLSSNTNDNDI